MGKMEDNLRLQRIDKIKRFIDAGINPYPNFYEVNNYSKDIIENYIEDIEVSVAGRIKIKRLQGKAGFMKLEDQKGLIQLYAQKDILDDKYSLFKKLDIGDIVGIKGKIFKTHKGEITIAVNDFTLLAKCIRVLPVVKEKDGQKFDAFEDKEQRYRQRYLDLIVNRKVREDFIIRSRIIKYIRNYLDSRGFIEVETPMMQPLFGGAAAKPFITHHNALDMDLYLRIAPELYLKRLIVGGMERVYELNRNFRNEGMDLTHNPEFTMLELYQSFANYETMIQIFEEMISGVVKEIKGEYKFPYLDNEIDFTPPFKRITYIEALKEYTGLSIDSSIDELKVFCHNAGIDIKKKETKWDILDEIFSEKVESNFIQPTLITEYPKAISPLAKSIPDNPDFVERFEPFVNGRELGNAFSELNDPIDQLARFEAQIKDTKQKEVDYDYITALEYGMPPAGGMGIGIDRLVMLLINTNSIRDTIFFPFMKKIMK